MDALTLESDQSKSVNLTTERVHRSLSNRMQRSAKVGWPWLAVAIGSVFIPMLHFVLVPAAVFAMLWFVIREMTTTYGYSQIELKCPECRSPYDDQEFARLPVRLMCFKCKVASTLRNAEIGHPVK